MKQSEGPSNTCTLCLRIQNILVYIGHTSIQKPHVCTRTALKHHTEETLNQLDYIYKTDSHPHLYGGKNSPGSVHNVDQLCSFCSLNIVLS